VIVSPQAELDFGTGDFSIDAWVRAVQCRPGLLSPIVDKWDPNTNTGFSFYLDHNPPGTSFLNLRINAATFMSSGSFPSTANPLANTGPWVHVAVTVNRTTGVGTFYINGAPAGTFTPPAGSITNTVSMLIGEIRPAGPRCEIAIDELELFKRELQPQEIQAIFNAGPAGKCKARPCTGAAGLASLDISTGSLPGTGSVDPIWTLVTPSSGPPAFDISKHPSWVTPPLGSDWIHQDNTPGTTNQPLALYVYETSFTVPSNISSFTVNLTYAADNNVSFVLSGPASSLPSTIASIAGFPPVNFNTLHTATFTLPGPPSGVYKLTASVGNQPDTPSGLLVSGTIRCESAPPSEPTADLGDAPDSTNNFSAPMTAYGGPANFPTVFNSSPPGPKHLQPKGLAWLGPDVSFENEADQGPDQDPTNNLDFSVTPPVPDKDLKDDGVALPIAIPFVCGQTQFQYTVTSTVAAKLYVNVWFDFNRDGDWDDPIQKCPLGPSTTGSFTEWAVQNQLINVSPPATNPPFTFTTPVFGAANPTKGSEMWMRITLTDQPIAPANGADASGPASGYKYGETEDYLLSLRYTELCGIKWNDLNGDGKKDANEPGLAGWTIEIKDANGNIIGYAVTDAQGKYCVVVPSPGTYTVSEQQQAGWTQTAPPTPGTYTVTVPPGRTDLNFGNQQKGKAEICVFKFEDKNGNGVRDFNPLNPNDPNNEPLLGGWQFNVSPAPLPPATSPVTTLPGGGICFGVSAPGTYTITEIVLPGWTPTTPTTQTVTVPPSPVNVFFGNKRAGVCDLAIKKTVDPNPPVAGQPFAFTVTVTNVGNGPCAPTTTVTDNLPIGFMVTSFNPNTAGGWTCPSGPPGIVCNNPTLTLQPGQSSMVFAVVGTMSPGISIENCAELKNPNDTNPNNNKDCIKVTVVGKCDLKITKTVQPNPVPSGQQVTITLTVQNVGTVSYTHLTLPTKA
jgi:uncharacterized repeat protein (TIGR01451 family)